MRLRQRLINTTNSMAVNKKKNNLLWWVCLLAYLLLMGYILFYASFFGREEHADYRYNLTLFQEIGRYYYLGIRTGSWNLFFMNVIGNICVFIPFGILLPKLFVRCKNIFLTVLLSFELSLCVEIIQLVTKVGSFDVDDLLLNTMGGLCGFLIYTICSGVVHGWKKT